MLALRRRCSTHCLGRCFHFAGVTVACLAHVLHSVLLCLVEQVCLLCFFEHNRTHSKERTAATPGRLGPHGNLNIVYYDWWWPTCTRPQPFRRGPRGGGVLRDG